MSHYTGAIPDTTVHASDWLEFAVCKGADDAMYPDNHEAGIAYAKQYCRACPVWLTCLRDAIRTGDDEHGIRGRLKPAERRAVARLLDPRQMRDDTLLRAAVHQVLHPSSQDGRTLRDIWDERAYVMAGGHMGWSGCPSAEYLGVAYTPLRVAFIADRGREPVGTVRRTCTAKGCVHPRHIADNVERHQAKLATEQAKAATG